MKTKLKPDEKIILELHPHWITMSIPVLLATLGIIVGVVLMSFPSLFWPGFVLAVALALFYLYRHVERKNNVWAITNLRVIDEEGIFTRHSKESPLEKINNISYTQTFFGKIFGYGNVEIQTAAEIGSTTYVMVDQPQKLKDTITRMQEEYKQSLIEKQASELAKAIVENHSSQTDLATELEKLFELKQKGILTDEEYQKQKSKLLN